MDSNGVCCPGRASSHLKSWGGHEELYQGGSSVSGTLCAHLCSYQEWPCTGNCPGLTPSCLQQMSHSRGIWGEKIGQIFLKEQNAFGLLTGNGDAGC